MIAMLYRRTYFVVELHISFRDDLTSRIGRARDRGMEFFGAHTPIGAVRALSQTRHLPRYLNR